LSTTQRVLADVTSNTARLILAVIALAGTLVLLAMQVAVPDVIYDIDLLVIGFFFGGVVQSR